MIDHSPLFAAYDRLHRSHCEEQSSRETPRNALQAFLHQSGKGRQGGDGFKRIQLCREALQAIDRRGFLRSFHQRLFHDNFIRSCARIFWKTEPAGSFARNHQKILEMNGWDHLSQEILVSTPRRWAPHLPLFGTFLPLFPLPARLTPLKILLLKLWYHLLTLTGGLAALAQIDITECCVEVIPLNVLVHTLSLDLGQSIQTEPLPTHAAAAMRYRIHPTMLQKLLPEAPPLAPLIGTHFLCQAGGGQCMTPRVCGDLRENAVDTRNHSVNDFLKPQAEGGEQGRFATFFTFFYLPFFIINTSGRPTGSERRLLSP